MPLFKLIDDLKRANPRKRIQLLTRMHERNVEFFARQNPQIAEFIKARGTGAFEIRVTDASIEILDRAGRNQYHPPGQLFTYTAGLGAWHHSAWVDKVLPQHVNRGDNDHGRALMRMVEGVYRRMPQHGAQVRRTGEVQLPPMDDGRRYSGAVVFLGVFTGLHIMQYLNRTAVRNMFLIEPDLDRFALSCYFLDYEKIQQLTGELMLHVGPEAPQNPIDRLINRAPITSASWVRLLPAYADGKFDDILSRVSLRWRALIEIYVPYDREVRNLVYGWRNLEAGLPVLLDRPRLSEGSTIAVVASGPSLAAEIPWLKENQRRMIIMCSISCVRVLKENGIRVDYQCTLDTEIDEPLLESLQMDSDVPVIAYYKLDPAVAARFLKVLLVTEQNKANPVRFKRPTTFTHPTTGNLMVAVASFLAPAKILLVGLDLGFREAGQSHIKGGWHDENEGSGHVEETGGRDHITVAANFPESEGQILSMAYYNNARFHVGDALAGRPKGSVVNLADGARIDNAEPMHSADLALPEYPDKDADKAAIEAGFSVDRSALWEPYPRPANELVRETFALLEKKVQLEGGFSWTAWTTMLDGVWEATYGEMIRKYGDVRIEVFAKLIYDALGELYKMTLVAASQAEAAKIYEYGLEELKKMLGDLSLPEELDAIVPDPIQPAESGSK